MNSKKTNDWLKSREDYKSSKNAELLYDEIKKASVSALSKAITLVESKNKNDISQANILIQKILSESNEGLRIGITGVPGVGKSTFIESFVLYLSSIGKKVAVLTIDPTSSRTKGSILGDKTRMNKLVGDKNVFIRPTSSGLALGGVNAHTRDAIILCEAFGFDIIIVETVGVGQSETEVFEMTDFFLLLMLAGAGDELQGIKRGIMEMADCIAITKSDGDNILNSKKAVQAYKNALHLFPPKENNWIPQVLKCSAYENENIDKIWEIICGFENQQKLNGEFNKNRTRQNLLWFKSSINYLLESRFLGNAEIQQEIKNYENFISEGKISPLVAANEIMDKVFNKQF